jgi:hypothetical protein
MDEVRYQNPLSKRFLEVGASAGLGTNEDFNNWSRPQDGVGRFQVSEKNGERCSGATAFLSKAMKRKNCKVRTGTMVRRIDFDESKTAVGVTYDLMGDDTCTVSCFQITGWGAIIHFSCHLKNLFCSEIPSKAQSRWRSSCGKWCHCFSSAPHVQWNWSCKASPGTRYPCRTRQSLCRRKLAGSSGRRGFFQNPSEGSECDFKASLVRKNKPLPRIEMVPLQERHVDIYWLRPWCLCQNFGFHWPT